MMLIRPGTYKPGLSVAERFWTKVQKTESGCWEWQAAVGNGYGQIRISGRCCRAHVLSYEWAKGPIPEGLELDHLCLNKLCVNPEHLEAVTHQENMSRVAGMGQACAKKTHCKYGHPFDLFNTYYVAGTRRCKICGIRRQRECRHRKRQRIPV